MRAAALVLVSAALLPGCGGGDDARSDSDVPPPREMAKALAGAPRPLAKLHEQGGRLLGGGAEAFRRRLAQLRGYPVVVNKWASWCPPCRAEFPFFQREAIKRGKKVAFIGVDSTDNDEDAAKFLKEFPVPYPSYRDPRLEVAAVFKGVAAFPSTAFYDSEGRLAYLKQGGYSSRDDLAEDIERYAR